MFAWIPEGFHSVTPRLVVTDPAGLVEFLKEVFRATGDFAAGTPSQMRIGDSIVMVSGAGPRNPITALLYVYVEDCDATHTRALKAGCVPVEEPCDTPYGDRRSMVTDPWGNDWQIATYRAV